MTSKFALATAAALIAFTSAASAAGVSYTDSQRDLQLQAQADRAAPAAAAFVTTPAIDPAYSQRDVQLQAQAGQGNGAIVTTHGNAAAASSGDLAYDFALGSN